MSSNFLLSDAWAWAVITDGFLMSLSSYCLWVVHEDVQLLLFTNAWAWQDIA